MCWYRGNEIWVTSLRKSGEFLPEVVYFGGSLGGTQWVFFGRTFTTVLRMCSIFEKYGQNSDPPTPRPQHFEWYREVVLKDALLSYRARNTMRSEGLQEL